MRALSGFVDECKGNFDCVYSCLIFINDFFANVIEIFGNYEIEKLIDGVLDRLRLLFSCQKSLKMLGLVFFDVYSKMHENLNHFGDISGDMGVEHCFKYSNSDIGLLCCG